MTLDLTYTTGFLAESVNAEFERHLDAARSAGPGEACGQFIAGETVIDGTRFDRPNPAHTDELASVALEATPALVERALAAAKDAHARWRRLSFAQRTTALRRVAEQIRARHIEIAATLSLETGKTRAEAIAEVQEGIDLIETYARMVEENGGWSRPLKSLQERESNRTVLKPYGVFGVLCPFNFPFALTIGMTFSALLAGNTVIVKPSEQTPATGALLVELMRAADLAPGVFNLLQGGPQVGKLLVCGTVDGVAFTGSAEVGRQIAQAMQAGPFTRPALMEMGGKNPTIITASADLEAAAEGVARAAFGLSGQKCSACSRAIVDQSVHDEFLERLVEFTQTLRVGDPADPGVFLGPVINADSCARFDAVVERARQDGRLVLGGRRPDLPGYFVEPTVVSNLSRGHELTRRELFLPLVTVTAVGSLDEALVEANAVDYGLTAGIFTADEHEQMRFLDEIQAGVTYVNRRAGATTGAWPGAQTFCGWKASGSTGKGALGPWYVPQFMREQSQTVVG